MRQAYVCLVLDDEKEPKMGIVMTVCRSYSVQEFDSCPACLDAALEAVVNAAMYVLGHAAPSLASGDPESSPLEMAYRLKVQLFDDEDRPLAGDEYDTEQTVSAVAADDETAEAPEDDESGEEPAGSMRLDDFQTLLDLVELAPAGSMSASGAIRGRLFGFERAICRFEVEVCRDR
jgi:hypothetical protein